MHPPEWTLLFRAARIALPPNPVVSRFRLGEDGNPNPILPEVLAVVLAALKGRGTTVVRSSATVPPAYRATVACKGRLQCSEGGRLVKGGSHCE